MGRMHADELDITVDLVRRLLAEQFPRWSELPLVRIEPSGTDNAVFRLGSELCVRLARRDGPAQPGGKEHDWLPRLAPQLPLVIPLPLAQGRPGTGYPWFWDIYSWVEGDTAGIEAIDAVEAASDIARFIAALQRVDPAGAPAGRGRPLAEFDAATRAWIAQLGGDPVLGAEWQRALAVPAWAGPPTWHHGDLDVRNWLLRDGRIAAVIDWASTGVGDPACDVSVAWKLHSAQARAAFRAALPTDDATWQRARGWTLWQSIGALAYYTPENNAALYHEAESWLEQVLGGP